MTLRQAVDRAMRSGRVVAPDEFEAIYGEAAASLDITQLHSGDYLFRGADATALRRMRFRSDEERREFGVGLLGRARERVLGQLAQMLEAVPAEDRASSLGCFITTEGTAAPVTCYTTEGTAIWAGFTTEGSPAHSYYNGLLAFLGRALPAQAFVGLTPPDYREGTTPVSLAAIQLLDGVFFTVENFRAAELPAETRISSGMIRSLYRSQVCPASAALPDCR